jgi:hypothetical protein
VAVQVLDIHFRAIKPGRLAYKGIKFIDRASERVREDEGGSGGRRKIPRGGILGWFAPLYKWKKEINLPAMQLGGSSETKLNSNTCNIENSFAPAAAAAAARKGTLYEIRGSRAALLRTHRMRVAYIHT